MCEDEDKEEQKGNRWRQEEMKLRKPGFSK
jgi:hypothetical protein